MTWKTMTYGVSNPILLSYYYLMGVSKSICIATIIGIGNKSVSHDLYLSIRNMIWYIHVMSKATSCFFIYRHIIAEL